MKSLILQILRERRLKLTPQRLAIVDALIKHFSFHPGAGLIFREAKKRTKSLSLSTVYATLNEFSEIGIIKILEFDKMENRCEVNMASHFNLICKRCGKITDYSPSLAINLEEVAKKTRFRVTDTRLEFYGYCDECRKNR